MRQLRIWFFPTGVTVLLFSGLVILFEFTLLQQGVAGYMLVPEPVKPTKRQKQAGGPPDGPAY